MARKPEVTLTFAGDSDRLTREMSKVDRAADKMSRGVDKSSTRMADKTKGASDAMRTGIAAGATAIAAGAATGVTALVQLGKSLDAMDVKAQTVFGNQLAAVQAWAEENRRAFGASSREVVAMAGNMADLLKPMGFTTAEASKMSMKMLDLSGALSRWTGGTRTAAEVSELLADAMLGETDGLKGLGIAISAADVDARLAAKGQEELTGAAEAQARAIATQELILEKSTDAQKAWAEGGREAAEAQNGLSSTMAESAEQLAAIVAPAFERLVQVLESVVEWISQNQTAAIVLGSLAAAIWLVNAALNANPIMLVVTLVAGLVAAIVFAFNKFEWFRNGVLAVWGAVSGAARTAASWVVNAWGGVMDFFRNLPGNIGKALGQLGSIISGAFKGAMNFLIEGLNRGINIINEAIGIANHINPFDDIPHIPHIPKLHTGGYVPGPIGSEQLAVLQGGERVMAHGQGGGPGAGGVTVAFVGDTDSAFADAFMHLVRTGQIQLGT